jgi:anti-sigma factor RsiW
MHPPIENELELFLEGKPTSGVFTEHLAQCAECKQELALFSEASLLVRSLRLEPAADGPVAAFEPAPGFYARVVDRIESQIKPSFWSVFLQPFGRRLVYASLALFVVLCGLLFTGEPPKAEQASAKPETIWAPEPETSVDAAPAIQVDHRVGAPENRGATLVNLTKLDQ